jgi:hypothetical protein
MSFEAAHAGWTEWEPLPGAGGDSLVAIRHDAVSAAGLALTAGLALALWALRRRPFPWLPRLLAGAVTVAGLGLVWLPAALQFLAWWPLLVGCAGVLLWYLRAVAQPLPAQPSPPPATTLPVAATVALLLFGATVWGGRTAPPAPPDYTVYLLPESDRTGDKPAVLVPAELLDQLQALSRAPTSGPGAVLLGASYNGRVSDGAAEFDAEFSVLCLDDQEAPVLIPLEGVQLQGDVWLDGAPARPSAATPPQVGYVLKAAGRGRHKVELRFRVPLAATAEDRNVQFGIPRSLQSRLVFRLPAGATHPRAPVRQGAAHRVHDDQGERLEVDLGRVAAPVHLRWHQPAQPPVRPLITFRDAYLWDLRPDGSTVTGLVRYTIPRGATDALVIDVPPELEVRGVEMIGNPGDGSGPRLRGWQMVEAPGERSLRLEFASPVSGDVPVSLDLVPKEPLPAALTLSAPRPRGQRLTGENSFSFIGYRARGLDAQPLEQRNVIKQETVLFSAFWPEALRPDPVTFTFAYGTWPDAYKPPLVRLRLDLHPARIRARQDLVVRTGLRQADVGAVVELSAPAGELSFVEWLLSPGLTITSVTGAEVRHWCQTGNLLLVWLEGARDSARVEWSGWLATMAREGGDARLAFPRVQPLSAVSVQTTLHLQAGPGLSLDPGNVPRGQFQVPPDFRPSGRELVYVTKQPDYGGTCWVRPTTANAEARVLTLAEVRDGRLTFTATVDFPVVHGELRSVQIRLSNWEGEEVHLYADQVARAPVPRQRQQGDRSWTLELKPGVHTGYRLQLTGSMPLREAGADVPMPDVSVVGIDAPSQDCWLAVCGGELAGESASGLRAFADPVAVLKDWPDEAERLRRAGGSLWHVTDTDWRLRLVTREHSPGSAPVRVYLTERSAAVADGRRWLHESVFWLRHEANTDLNVTLPAPADVVTATIDDVGVAALQPDRQRVWLALPGQGGLRKVRLRWLFAEAEPLDRPNLARPRPEGVVDGPVVWSISIPPGWKVADGDLRPGAGVTAALDLHRASALLTFCRQLTEGGRERGPAAAEALATAQYRFYQSCLEAGHVLDLAGDGVTLTGPGRQSLREWLGELLARNQELATRQGFDEVRVEAERDARAEKPVSVIYSGAPIGRGTPVFAQAAAESPTPRLQLVPEASHWAALLVTAQWLAVAAVVWGLSFVPTWAARLRPFWPEQVLLLGLLGWYLAGPTLAVLFLFVLGASGRVVVLGSRVGSLFHRLPRKSGSSVQTQA